MADFCLGRPCFGSIGLCEVWQGTDDADRRNWGSDMCSAAFLTFGWRKSGYSAWCDRRLCFSASHLQRPIMHGRWKKCPRNTDVSTSLSSFGGAIGSQLIGMPTSAVCFFGSIKNLAGQEFLASDLIGVGVLVFIAIIIKERAQCER